MLLLAAGVLLTGCHSVIVWPILGFTRSTKTEHCDGRAYRIAGTVRSNRFRIEHLVLSDFRAGLKYADGVLAVDELSTVWNDDGRLTGTASLQSSPQGDMVARLQAEELGLAPLYDLLLQGGALDGRDAGGSGQAGGLPALLRGVLSGEIAARVPLDDLREVPRWKVNANLVGQALSIDESIPLNIRTGPVSLDQGSLRIPKLRIESPVDGEIAAAVNLRAEIGEQPSFSFDAQANDLPMRSLGRLASFSPTSPIEGKLDLQFRGEGGWTTVAAGQPESFQWSIAGQVASPDISVFGVSLGLVEHDFIFDTDRFLFEQRLPSAADGVRNTNVYVERLAADYQINEQAIELSSISGKIFGGEVEGAAEVPRDEQGVVTTSLTWREIVPRIKLGKYLPGEVELALRTSGEIDWQVPIGQIAEPAAHEGSLRVVAD